MSSYLSIYIVPKRKTQDEPKQHLLLTAYSRSTDIYQYFNENIHPVFIGSEYSYTTITWESITSVLQDFDNDIKKCKDRLMEYEKYASDNPEYIDDILGMKDYIENLQYWKYKVSFIQDILGDMEYSDTIEEVCCNID